MGMEIMGFSSVRWADGFYGGRVSFSSFAWEKIIGYWVWSLFCGGVQFASNTLLLIASDRVLEVIKLN